MYTYVWVLKSVLCYADTQCKCLILNLDKAGQVCVIEEDLWLGLCLCVGVCVPCLIVAPLSVMSFSQSRATNIPVHVLYV